MEIGLAGIYLCMRRVLLFICLIHSITIDAQHDSRYIIQITDGDTTIIEKPFADNSRYMYIERFPEPAIDILLSEFIKTNMHHPSYILGHDIHGNVLVQLKIDEYGKVDSFMVLKSVHPLLDKEALRLVRLIPAWKPAIKDGKPYAMKYTVRVNF